MGYTNDPTPNLSGSYNFEVEDPEDEIFDPKFEANKLVLYPAFDHNTPWDQCKPVLGTRFESRLQLKRICQTMGLQMDTNYGICRNYTMGSLVTYRWIPHHYEREINDNPNLPHRTMQTYIKQKFLINVSWGQCKREKQCALFDHEGGLIDH